MNELFPTFRRLRGRLSSRTPFPSGMATASQSLGLLQLLLIAYDYRLTLGPLVSAFAQDHRGRQRDRLKQLADCLDAGVSLPDAVEQVPGVLSDEGVLAVRFGCQTGTLGPTLRDVLQQTETDLAADHGSHAGRKTAYLVMLTIVFAFGASFLLVKILPTFAQIMTDFGTQVPPAFTRFVGLGMWIARYFWPLLALLLLFLWALWTGRIARSLRRGWLGRLFQPLTGRRGAEVLRYLSVALAEGRPITGAVSTLARYHYNPSVRHRLLFVRNEIEQGTAPWKGLRDAHFLNDAELVACEAAGRVENQPWMLTTLAARRQRRFRKFARAASELGLPAIVFVFGGILLLIARAVFTPVVQIILDIK